MNETLHPRFKRKPFKNKYAPKVQYVYNFQSAKLKNVGQITMWQRGDEILLSYLAPNPEFVEVRKYKQWGNV